MSTTNQYPSNTGMTFEKVWDAMMESNKRMDRMERSMEETRKLQEETFRRMDKSQQELDKQLGRLGNRFGDVVEHLIRPGAAAKFNELGYHFDGETSNYKIKDPETGKLKTELDIVLENGKAVVVIEVKVNPDFKDLDHFAHQLQYYREHRLRLNPNDTKKIYGAIAAAVFPKKAQEAVIQLGYYVIIQSGDTVTIEVPEGFVPKAF